MRTKENCWDSIHLAIGKYALNSLLPLPNPRSSSSMICIHFAILRFIENFNWKAITIIGDTSLTETYNFSMSSISQVKLLFQLLATLMFLSLRDSRYKETVNISVTLVIQDYSEFQCLASSLKFTIYLGVKIIAGITA